MYKIQTLNKISEAGLSALPRGRYEIASAIIDPDAVIVRSADMLEMEIPKSVKIIARAGAGTNNIPIQKCTERGIVVVNTPGANANAVKELTLSALFFSSRPVFAARDWVKTLAGKCDEIPALAEKGKSKFVGPEIKGKTLGVIGLGAIGAMVANDAVQLGMDVVGYDPFLSVDSAWMLSRAVRKAESLDALLAQADYITLHVPQTPETKGFINMSRIRGMKQGVRLINLARGGLVVNEDVLAAIESGKIECFVSDFSDEALLKNDKVICLPHLGASTPEAEDNCARMAANQVMDFLETGAIVNSVNFPRCRAEGVIPENGARLCVANKNVPSMIGQITGALAANKLNIAAIGNQSRGDIAYNIIDLERSIDPGLVKQIENIEGVVFARVIDPARIESGVHADNDE